MNAKLMIYGLSNTGKTTLLETLKDALVISYDGKDCSLAIPHVDIKDFTDIQGYIDQVGQAIQMYEAKLGCKPKTLAIDTLSSVVFKLYDICQTNYSNFHIYSENNKRLNIMKEFIQFLAKDYNIVILSHCILDEETGKMSEPLSGKQFKAVGGFLASVDYACYISYNKRKRELYLKNHELARSLLKDYPDTVMADDFNLQEYLEAIESKANLASEWKLG